MKSQLAGLLVAIGCTQHGDAASNRSSDGDPAAPADGVLTVCRHR